MPSMNDLHVAREKEKQIQLLMNALRPFAGAFRGKRIGHEYDEALLALDVSWYDFRNAQTAFDEVDRERS